MARNWIDSGYTAKKFEFVFPEKELCGLSPNFLIHVAVSDLYIPTFESPIFLQQNRQADQININRLRKLECRNWDCRRAVPFLGTFVSNFRYCTYLCSVGHQSLFVSLSLVLLSHFFSLSKQFFAA